MKVATPVERMKKILALARRGIGGEKTTAEAMLQKLLAKYSMTVADLENEAQPIEKREFKYATEYDRRLLSQIVASVLETRSLTSWRRRGKKIILYELTALQYAEVDVRYNAYRGALRKELDKASGRVYAAFVQANDLGVGRDDDDDSLPPDIDLAELEAIVALMRTMEPTPIYRQLERAA